MKITTKSKILMSFFIKHKYIKKNKQNKTTNNILSMLYNEILNAHNYLTSIKTNIKLKTAVGLYNIHLQKINSSIQIPIPKIFDTDSFPLNVRKNIVEQAKYVITYKISLYNRDVKIIFISEDNTSTEQYNKYIDSIVMWLFILNKFGSKTCSKTFTLYLYFTKLEKTLPNTNMEILNRSHVNTAYTTSCPKNSEIVIFRKEEWFKVFMHETFHNFGLDFSEMDNTDCNNFILSVFPVSSEVNLYESYAEVWAEIMNALFCSFFSVKNKSDIVGGISYFETFINIEISHSFFQLVKVLNFMGLTYEDLYSKSARSACLRLKLYKEKSNVLAYYIIKTILLNSYNEFLLWCSLNNDNILQFKKTYIAQRSFCGLINKTYKIALVVTSSECSSACLFISPSIL